MKSVVSVKLFMTQSSNILIVVALDEASISICLHFLTQNIDQSCDLDRATGWSNSNINQ